MKINFYRNYPTPTIVNKNKDKTSFTGNTINCYDTTEFLRDDFDWQGFSHYINNFYKDTPKVNVVSYACSNGKETYSLALVLKTNLRQNVNKFLPIIAKDIDKTNILKAKIGRYKINNFEANKIDKAGDFHLSRHLEIIDDGLEKYAFVKNSLKNIVNFSVADITKDIDSIPTQNTVLLCRNFWGYLSGKDQLSLIDKLSQRLDKTCLIAIGSFDKAYGINKVLMSKGFIETEIPNLLKKLK